MKVRVDKYLHAIRIFKTRTIASQECGLGKVLVNGTVAKASREVQQGDEITIRFHGFYRSLKVIKIIEKRTSAALAMTCYEETTPEEERLKKDWLRFNKSEYREKGTGRPTKKERRQIDKLKGF